MSEFNHDQFEAWINRYLDGDLKDHEFEQYLRSIDANLDLERLKLFRTRIEKIEELYIQIEEPAVPDGYWDEFSDRVSAKLSPVARPSLKDRIFAFFTPTRWPNVTYRYAGAVASVLVVFLIGNSLMKSGSDEYTPHEFPSEEIEQIPPSPSKQISIEETGEEKRDENTKLMPEQTVYEPESVQLPTDVVEIVKAERDIMEKSRPASVMVNADDRIDIAPVEKPEADQATVIDRTRGAELEESDDESESVQPPTDVVVIVKAERDIMEMSKPTSNVTFTSEQMSVMPVQNVDEILATSVGVSRSQSEDIDKGESNYDNKTLDSLRAQLIQYEKLPTDSLYADSAFIDFAKIKSSIAFITRDSTDIYDAIGAIDSLLIRNSHIRPQDWTTRRDQLNKILENPNNK